MSFPKNFTWGAATASFQIEGGYDTRGKCIWDMMCEKSGAVAFGHDGKTACDHYNRFREDVALMKQLGIKAYRFSLSWPRLIPDGLGKINPDGVRFYNELIDELLKNGIEPYITLFHWDYPLSLYEKGGWLNPESPEWFAEYTKIAVELFSDRVKYWFTLNETQCFISVGHANGEHAPGLKMSEYEVMLCAHHAHLAHGRAVQTIRKYSKQTPQIGFAPVGDVKVPATDSPEDIRAAYEEMFRPINPHYWGNAIWIEPVMTGKYPDEISEYYEKNGIKITDEDMKIIGQPIDFLGMNIYSGARVSASGKPVAPKVGFDQTAIGWEIVPESLYWGPKFYWERYKKPIFITENGMANVDLVSADGKVHDPQRIEYLRRYLKNLRRASEEGAEILGYFQWSLMDNFEWAEGYQKRFGLIYIDYETKQRIPKDSFEWYSDTIAKNGENL